MCVSWVPYTCSHESYLGAILIAKVKREPDEEETGLFSPETKALIKGLGDSPESMALKAEILSAANELRRGNRQHELIHF